VYLGYFRARLTSEKSGNPAASGMIQ